MKTIEIKEDGKVIGTRYLKPISNLLVNRYDIHVDGAYYDIVNEPPYLYLDQNGKQVYEGQQIWIVNKDEKFFNGTFPIWEPFVYKVEGARPECFAIFTTKEAADQFVADNRPKPFFITHDGVAMEKGSKAFIVESEMFWKEPATVTVTSNNGKWLYFSTEQSANDYIKKKKLSLSLDMIEKMMNATFDWSKPNVSDVWMALTKLVNEQFKPQ